MCSCLQVWLTCCCDAAAEAKLCSGFRYKQTGRGKSAGSGTFCVAAGGDTAGTCGSNKLCELVCSTADGVGDVSWMRRSAPRRPPLDRSAAQGLASQKRKLEEKARRQEETARSARDGESCASVERGEGVACLIECGGAACSGRMAVGAM